MTHQTVTCPHCGSRAEIILEFKMDDFLSQLCKCLNIECRYIFIEQEDETMENQLR